MYEHTYIYANGQVVQAQENAFREVLCELILADAVQGLALMPLQRHASLLRISLQVCDTLQLTATHCNTLQLTATHCNTLQLTATHCDTL